MGLAQARAAGLLSDEHFTVDGTLLEAWASLKNFRRTDEGPASRPDDPGNPTLNFHGESRRNDTHASTTDPEASQTWPEALWPSAPRESPFTTPAHLQQAGPEP